MHYQLRKQDCFFNLLLNGIDKKLPSDWLSVLAVQKMVFVLRAEWWGHPQSQPHRRKMYNDRSPRCSVASSGEFEHYQTPRRSTESVVARVYKVPCCFSLSQ